MRRAGQGCREASTRKQDLYLLLCDVGYGIITILKHRGRHHSFCVIKFASVDMMQNTLFSYGGK